MNPSKHCDLRLFYDLHIYVCLHQTLLRLQWVMPTCYILREHFKEDLVLLIFVVLLLLMATNVLVMFVPHIKSGNISF